MRYTTIITEEIKPSGTKLELVEWEAKTANVSSAFGAISLCITQAEFFDIGTFCYATEIITTTKRANAYVGGRKKSSINIHEAVDYRG